MNHRALIKASSLRNALFHQATLLIYVICIIAQKLHNKLIKEAIPSGVYSLPAVLLKSS